MLLGVTPSEKRNIKMEFIAAVVDYTPILDSFNDNVSALTPIVVTAGGAVLGVVGLAALYSRFGPALIKKLISRAS
jgi:hypothetical protein